VLECVAVCFSMLQGHNLTICRALLYKVDGVDCVLQCVAACCSVLQCVAVLQCLQCVAVLQCVQSVAVCCSLCVSLCPYGAT